MMPLIRGSYLALRIAINDRLPSHRRCLLLPPPPTRELLHSMCGLPCGTSLRRQLAQRDRVKADLLICFDSKLNSRLSGNEYDDKRGECATLPQKKKRKRQLVAEHKTQQCSSLVTTREKLFQLSSSLIVSHAGRQMSLYTAPSSAKNPWVHGGAKVMVLLQYIGGVKTVIWR